MLTKWFLILGMLTVFLTDTCAQESTGLLNNYSPSAFLDKITKKSQRLQQKVERQTQRYLQRLQKQEQQLQRQLQKNDSSLAAYLFNNTSQCYQQWSQNLQQKEDRLVSLSGEYLPAIDSLQTSLNFLHQQGRQLTTNSQVKHQISQANTQVNNLVSKLQQTEEIRKAIRERQQHIKEVLGKYTYLPKGITKTFNKYRQQFYYYSQQISEYKQLLNDPDKLQKAVLAQLNKLPAFQKFVKEHSQLAGFFQVPEDYASVNIPADMQTKEQVQKLIQAKLGAGGPNAQQLLLSNFKTAQIKLEDLKNKLLQPGSSGTELDMPDFRPNTQKTKSFFKRLELSTNMQSTRADNYFPNTTDLGLSLGYKLSDKNTIGIGSSFKMGWGRNIRHINITSQGIGLRSFVDSKLKGSFYISGGFEYNYQPPEPIEGTPVFTGLNQWQKSGLVGISKIVSVKSNLFKKTKVQLLWDFLSYQQTPRTQPLKFRLGYNL